MTSPRSHALAMGAVLVLAAGCSNSHGSDGGAPTCNHPIAVLDGDQTVRRGARVVVDGSTSRNLDGFEQFDWQVIGPDGKVTPFLHPNSFTVGSEIEFTADDSGVYIVTLTIQGFGDQACGDLDSTAQVHITSVNTAPVANAGTDQTVHAGKPVTLDGSASTDADSNRLDFHWSVLSAPAASTAAIESEYRDDQPSFTPDLPGEYTIGLVVNDGELDSAQATVEVTATNQPPTGSLSDPFTSPVEKGTSVFANVNASDPDGDRLTYRWTISSAPAGSAATIPLEYLDEQDVLFKPDIEGDYLLTLTISDPFSSTAVTTMLTATDEAPFANAGADVAAVRGEPVALSGTAVDPEGDPLTFAWTIDSAPVGSAATLSDPSSPSPSFVPDLEGSYTLTFTARDRTRSGSDALIVTAYRPIAALDHDVLAAAKDDALGVLLLASSAPGNSLFLYDPASGAETAVPLPLAPQAVAVSADGQHAAVGHNGYVSYIDLTTPAVVGSPMRVPIDVDSVALTADFIYATARGTHPAPIYAVRVSDGAVSTSTASGGGASTVQPDSTLALTGDGSGLYVSDGATLDRFSPVGTPEYLYSTSYAASEASCGGLWFAESQLKLLTACGLLFSIDSTATTNDTTDLIYAGALDGYSAGGTGRVQWADDSAAAQELAAIPSAVGGGDDRQLELYSDGYFNRVGALALPGFVVAGQARPAHGRFVFHSADGAERYVIVQSEDSSGSLSDTYGVVTYGR